ncbi:class I SAM-dependent methyltransferase [Amycolatopsis rubida]|uniref:Methyltransferase domain-containing protein n=1 Tax=Amycolatopsis rubida TaxID=112413 RepID=A0A1I5J7Q2_9PSEU|nr:class I SAM-dependent methyltransferase [Amycolatopsis rubida]SFO68426.1 Methyltransferase domain-containing protein [Amycolatopsis rubida]
MSKIFGDHAERYTSFAESSGPNAHYERPATLRLAGEVAGKQVLELGSAGGGLTEQLAAAGAEVLGLDHDPRLVEIARKRLGARARFEIADLDEPLSMVPSASADLVVASLVLHYVADWGPLLAELRRCLKPGGALVFSIHHPITGWLRSDRADYHRVELISEDWDWDGVTVTGRMYRRPVSAVFTSLLEAGFAIEAVEEPQPAPGVEDPELDRILRTTPVFLYVRAVR